MGLKLPVARAAFELHNQRAASAVDLQRLRQKRDALICLAEPQQPELVIALLVHTPGHTAHAVERVVVEDHDLPVLRQLHVQLRAVACASRQPESLKGVFRYAFILAVQTAVGEIPPDKRRSLPLCGRAGRDQKQRQRHRRDAQPAEYGGLFQFLLKVLVHSLHLNQILYREAMNRIVSCGGVYLAKNTSQLSSVRASPASECA